MGNRSRSSSLGIVFGMAMITAVGLGWFLAKQSAEFPPPSAAGTSREISSTQKKEIHLYFGDSNGRYLSAQQRVMDQPADVASATRSLVEALIQGPLENGTRTLPQDANLRSVFVTPDGMAYVDFKADAFDHHPGGVETEMLTIYSIVNTLVLNMEEIRWVKFLIGGQEAATLAGHVDLSRAFKADMLWVR